jgi:hypothetical protein
MKPQIRRQLDELSRRTQKEYGKLVQKLLAIAFLESGAEHLVESSIQGIDLQVRLAGLSYAFEVKTSEGKEIKLRKKDLEGMAGHAEQGHAVHVVSLTSGLFDGLLFARFHPGELPSGKSLSAFQLRPYRDRDLETRITGAFESAVERHAEVAATERQPGLDRILATYPARHLA